MAGDERQFERRADNRELAERVAKIEKTLLEMADGASCRERKLDDLLIMVGSGKMAVRVLFWLGSGVVFLITAWQWIADHITFAARP